MHFDTTAPASAAPGDMWWSGGKLALAIDDLTSIQWVQISSASDAPMPGPWDFPDAPTTGQGFTPVPGGATLTWDGQMWTFPAAAGGGSVITIADAAPTGTVANTLWWDSDSGDLFVNYNDLDSLQWVQINTKAAATTGITDAPSDGTPYSRQDAGWVAAAAGAGGIAEAPTDGQQYARQSSAWTPFVAAMDIVGDVKSGFQTADHNGWVKLDGRAVSTLTVSQQAAAATLGFTANLPDAQRCSLRQDSAAAPGVVGGSEKIGVNNLPAHNMTAASSGAHTHTTDSQGDHAHPGARSVYAQVASSVEVAWDRNEPDEYRGAHTHTAQSAGAHTHTVALGGGGVDYWVKAVVVTFFVFLGA